MDNSRAVRKYQCHTWWGGMGTTGSTVMSVSKIRPLLHWSLPPLTLLRSDMKNFLCVCALWVCLCVLSTCSAWLPFFNTSPGIRAPLKVQNFSSISEETKRVNHQVENIAHTSTERWATHVKHLRWTGSELSDNSVMKRGIKLDSKWAACLEFMCRQNDFYSKQHQSKNICLFYSASNRCLIKGVFLLILIPMENALARSVQLGIQA